MPTQTSNLNAGYRLGYIWLIFLVTMSCVAWASRAGAQVTNVLESRLGADAGAKPCKYDVRPRPSVLVTPERLALIRQEIMHGHGERRAIYEKYTKANADRWVHRPITIPDIGGWAHDFFCTDGTMLELPANQQFEPDIPSQCPVCGKVYLNDKVLAARCYFEHVWLAQAVRDLALAYAIEQKKEYADKATEILTKYADAYPQELGNGGFQRFTLAEATCLIPMAEGYDLIYDTMTSGQRTHIERDFFWPAAQSLTKAGFKGNWGSWHLSAIGVIGYATRHQRFIDFATEQFKSQMAGQLGDDGLWPESVQTYHFYALDAFLAFTEAAANCGDDLYSWKSETGKGIEAMFTPPLWYAYPNLRLAAINDGWYEAYLPRDQYTVAYYRYRKPLFAWAIQGLKQAGKSGDAGTFFDTHYRDLVDGTILPQSMAKPIFVSTNFPVLGIATLRQGSDLPPDQEMMMTFHYGPFLGHGHYDKMGVTLFAQGKPLVPAYGTTGYATGLSRFLQSAPGHNTIVFDGKNQPPTKDRDLIAFTNTPEIKLAAARTSELARGTTWTRTVMLADQYALVWDRIESTREHQYDWFFHAEGENFSLPTTPADESSTNLARGEFPYPLITEVQKGILGGSNAVARWISRDGGLCLWLMTNPGEVVFEGKYPTPEAGQVTLLVLRQKSKSAEFLAVLYPRRGMANATEPQVQFHRGVDNTDRVTVTIGGREDQIRLGRTVDYQSGGAQPISVTIPR